MSIGTAPICEMQKLDHMILRSARLWAPSRPELATLLQRGWQWGSGKRGFLKSAFLSLFFFFIREWYILG